MAASVAQLIVAAVLSTWTSVTLWDTAQFFSAYGPDPDLKGQALQLLALTFIADVALLLGGWSSWTKARAARRRYLGRLQALAGSPNAIPRAQVSASPAQAPDLDASGGQFRLLWQTTAAGRRNARIGYAVVQLFLGAMLIVMLFMLFALFSQSPFSFGLDWRSAQEIGALALVVIVGVGIPIGLWIFAAIAVDPHPAARPYGVIATCNGLTSIAASGKTTYIPWSEARVLEVFFSSPSENVFEGRYQL